MALIDYKGYRLIAESILPIEKHTLVVNSNDAGRHVKNSSPELQEKLKQSATILGLKSHLVGSKATVQVHSAVDLEGHIGKNLPIPLQT
jgi:hypothetical protein